MMYHAHTKSQLLTAFQRGYTQHNAYSLSYSHIKYGTLEYYEDYFENRRSRKVTRIIKAISVISGVADLKYRLHVAVLVDADVKKSRSLYRRQNGRT